MTIKEVRKKIGKTQAEMGEYLGISRVAYWQKENGHRSFKASEILLICKLAGVDPRTLTL